MSPEKKKKTTRRAPKKKVYNDKHIITFLFSICLVLTLFLGTVLFGLESLHIPDIKNVSHYKPMQASYILDRHGNVVERIFVENRTVVPLDRMPPLLGRAFVAAEDGRFFEHPGLDVISVFRAAINNAKSGRRGQGGSTITQQVAKSLLLTPEKTYIRKLKEAILAWRIDTLLSKEDILYIYLNQIYLGGGAHGVEAASQAYFDKHVWDLNIAEMAILAGLPQAPSKYSPLKHPERAIARQKYVLNRMAADGYINRDQAQTAFATKLKFGENKIISRRESGYYTQVVKSQVEKILDEPLTKAAVTIQTYLDSDMQKKAVASLKSGTGAVAKRTKQKSPQGAIVSVAGCSGRVRTLVGGTDYVDAPFNRAYQAKRPAGSVFKPLVYATALTLGWRPNSTILDAKLSIKGGDGKTWTPKNFSGQYHGKVTLIKALTHSYNIPAIRLLQSIGVTAVHDLAKKSGISSKLTPDLSLALGTVDVSPLEMTATYSSFICGGVYSPPQFIHQIKNSDDQIINFERKPKVRVMSQQVAVEMKLMLKSVVSSGTGKKAKGLKGETGGKTGTTNDNRDAWFVGFNEKMLTGVWLGHDMNKGLGKKENGGNTAAPVWFDYMKKLQ